MTINTRVFLSTRRLLLLTPVFVSTDHQETATTEQSDKFPSVRETAKQVQAAPEEEEEDKDEEEEEEEDGDKIKETTEENTRGSN